VLSIYVSAALTISKSGRLSAGGAKPTAASRGLHTERDYEECASITRAALLGKQEVFPASNRSMFFAKAHGGFRASKRGAVRPQLGRGRESGPAPLGPCSSCASQLAWTDRGTRNDRLGPVHPAWVALSSGKTGSLLGVKGADANNV